MAAFITLDDAKRHLNFSDNVNDAELLDYITAACDEVEQWVGPISTRVITGEFVDLMGRTIYNELTTAGTRAIVLRYRPVQSIQSIASAIIAGVTYTPSDFIIDTDTGIIRRGDGGTIFGPLLVSYTAGYTAAPMWAQLAARMITAHLWRTQRGGGVRGQGSGNEQAVPGFSFTVPPQAAALMESHRVVPGIG